MTFLPLLKQGAGAVGLDDDIAALVAIVEMAKKFEASQWPADFPGVVELLEAVQKNVNAPKVVSAFATLGLEPARAKVAGLLGKVQAAGAKVPDWAKTLLSSVERLGTDKPGELSWTPLKADETVTLDEALGLALGFKGSVALGLSAGAAWPDKDETLVKPLLRMGVDGSVGGEAGAKVPFKFGEVKLGADLGAEMGAHYYYSLAGEHGLYVTEVAERLLRLPNPFDYESVSSAVQAPDFAGARFVFSVKGGGHVDVTLEADGVPIPGVNMGVKASVRFAVGFKRGYVLAVTGADAGGGRAVRARVSRTQLDSRELGGSIGIEVALPVLAAKVERIVNQAVAKWDDALKEIRPFLSPGTYLQDQLAGLIDESVKKVVADAGLRAALESDLKELIGVDVDGSSRVEEWLKDAFKGAIDTRSAALLDSGQARIDALYIAIADYLPVAAGREEVKAAIRGELEKLVGKAEAELRKAAEDLWNGFADKTRLGKLLNDAGVKADKAVGDLNDLLKRVRELLDNYNKLIQKVATTAKEAAKKKISLVLHAENKRSEELSLHISGVFVPGHADAAATYRKLVSGDLDALKGIVANAANAPGFTRDAKIWIKQTSKLEIEDGYSFMFFGFGGEGTVKLTATAEAEVDGDGNVEVATNGKLEKRFKGEGDERLVSFANAIALARTREAIDAGGPASSRKVELGASITYRDDDLKRKELDAFLRLADQYDLVPDGTAERAGAMLTGWVGDKPNDHPPVDMAAKLWLEKEAAIRALRVTDGDRVNGRLTRDAKKQIMRAGMNALERVGWFDSGTFRSGLFRHSSKLGGVTDPVEVAFILSAADVLIDTRNMPHSPAKPQAIYLKKIWDMLHGLANVFDYAGEAYLSRPAGVPPRPGDWSAERYREQQRMIAEGSRGWLATSTGFGIAFSDEMNPRTVALMLVLAELGGEPARPLPTPLQLTFTNKKDAANPVTVPLP